MERIGRRTLFGRGLGGALGLFAARAGLAHAAPRRTKACVLLWLDGGPSHLDTFDPKPGTVTGGPTRAIDTAVRGLQFAEHFEGLAERAKHLAVVRSLSSREGDHQRARYLLHTGYVPSTTIRHPTWGSVLSAEASERTSDVPAYVCLGADSIGPGYRGGAHAGFVVRGQGGSLAPVAGLDEGRRTARRELLAVLEAPFRQAVGLSRGREDAFDRATALVKGPLRGALSLTGEGRRAAYGPGQYGEVILRARRLIEVGVPCVEVRLGGWDDHDDLFDRLPNRARALDRAVSALLDDLLERDLLDQTYVVCMGEFGRTPDLNQRGGRDHYPRAFSALLAGGGVRGGTVVGATSPDGREVAEGKVTVPDLFATLAVLGGLDPKARRYAGERPIALVDGGSPIRALLEA